MKFLLTNSETYTDYEAGAVRLHLWGRDENGERQHVEARGGRPHFYVPRSEVHGRTNELLGQNSITRISPSSKTAFRTGDPLSRVDVQYPTDVRPASELFEQSFGADVRLTDRLRIEHELYSWVVVPDREHVTIDEIQPCDPPVEFDPAPRICSFDIETDDRGGFPTPDENAITCLVAHDNYEDQYTAFINGGGRSITTMFPEGKPPESDAVIVRRDEKGMLAAFVDWIRERDPDMLTAWNGDFFDFPYLLKRLSRIGLSPGALSPLGDAFVSKNGKARIVGRTFYDLLKIYKANTWGELDSGKLDAVAQDEVGAEKIEHTETFYELWRDKPAKLVDYNARDVRLMVAINEVADTIEFRNALRKQVGVDFEATLSNNPFVEMMVRRKLHDRCEEPPTGDYSRASEDYTGAYVFDPSTGVFRNVVGIDVDSLYPWTMFMLNASPDTRVDVDPEAIITDTETGESVAVVDGESIPVIVAPNGAVFRRDRRGVMAELVEDAIGLKSEFKKLKKQAQADGDETLVEIYSRKYDVSKTITNSLYGTVGWEPFILYDRLTAEAVTLAGQEVIKRTAKYVNESTVATVRYGDTDSNYISFPDSWDQERCVREAERICEALETEVYPEVAAEMGIPRDECRWTLGPEMYGTFFQWGKKKRYAYAAYWKEGMAPDQSIDSPEPVVKGAASKRSDTALLTRDLETAIFDAVFSGQERDIPELIYEAGREIDPDDPDWNRIGIPGAINKPLADYASFGPAIAAENSNAVLGTAFGEGDKPKRIYIRESYFEGTDEKITSIAFDEPGDLAPILDAMHLDVQAMTATLIEKPLGDLLHAVDVDVNAALTGQSQSSLEAWI